MIGFQLLENSAVRDLGEFAKASQRAIDRVVRRTGQDFQQQVDRTIARLTGDLARSFVLRTNVGFALVGTPLVRARFNEFGTKRHPKGTFTVYNALQGTTRRLPDEIAAAIQAAV